MISNAMGKNGGLPDQAQRRENRMNRIGTSAPHTFCVEARHTAVPSADRHTRDTRPARYSHHQNPTETYLGT